MGELMAFNKHVENSTQTRATDHEAAPDRSKGKVLQ